MGGEAGKTRDDREGDSGGAGENSSTMFVSTFASCFGYQWVNRLRRIFGAVIAAIETDGA
jgi:hypothetical protein